MAVAGWDRRALNMQFLADVLLIVFFSTSAFLNNLGDRIFRKMLTFSTQHSESQYSLAIFFPRWKERWRHGAKCDLLDQKREVREAKSLFCKTEETDGKCVDCRTKRKDRVPDLPWGVLSV